ncbi:hypothetical protein T02_9141, partial [Trichinella nativa]
LKHIGPKNLLASLLLPLKSYNRAIFMGISRQIRICETFWKVLRHINAYVSNKSPLNILYYKNEFQFWKVLRHINAYVLNKWPLNFPCAHLTMKGRCLSDCNNVIVMFISFILIKSISPERCSIPVFSINYKRQVDFIVNLFVSVKKIFMKPGPVNS